MAKKKSDSPDVINSELEKLGCKIFTTLNELEPKTFIKTGLFAFDRIISDHEGFPGNGVVEIFGPNSTGKTSIALQVAARAQKTGRQVYYINAERGINSSIVKCFSDLDAEAVKWIEPDNGEAALDIMKTIMQTQPDSLIINDSIPACIPSNMVDASAGDSHVGDLARIFSKFMPVAKKLCRQNECLLLQLNQERAKIGPMARGGSEQPGGRAVKFYSDIRIKLTKKFKSGTIESGGDQIGHIITATAVKTRWTAPFQTADIPLIYGHGFDCGRELLYCAELYSVISKKGAWYYYYDEGKEDQEPKEKFHGSKHAAAWIRQNPEVQKEIISRLRKILT